MTSDNSFDRIEATVDDFRLRLGVPDDIRIDMADLLRRMKMAGEISGLELVPAKSLGKAAAAFDPFLNTITVSEESFDRQSVRDRFTYAHEIGHYLAGHRELRHRALPGVRQFGKQLQHDEQDANRFASALLIPERLAKVDQSTTADQLAQRFGVSLQMAEIRLLDLQRRHRVRNGIRRMLPTSIASVGKPASPETYDSGDYDSAMAEMARNAARWNS